LGLSELEQPAQTASASSIAKGTKTMPKADCGADVRMGVPLGVYRTFA
jgi:hypothetical protein